MKGSRLLLSFAVSALVLMGCSVQAGSGLAAPQPPAAVTPVPLPTRVVAAKTTVSADGVVQTASAPISLAAAIDAKVASVNVEPGQRVKLGEVLAMLDSTSLRDALEDAKLQQKLTEAQIKQNSAPASAADVESAKAALSAAQLQYGRDKRGPTQTEIEEARMSLEAARANYLAAQINRDVYCGTPALKDSNGCKQQEATFGNAYESEVAASDRYKALLQPVTKEKLQQSFATVAQAQARLQALETDTSPEQQKVFAAQLTQARSAVTRSESNLRETTVLSPCDCVVQEVNISVGIVPKGVAMTLVNLQGLQFKTTNLTERELANVQVGQTAEVRLRALDKTIAGRVEAILPQSSGAQGDAALFTVLITLGGSEQTTLPGMTGQVVVDTQSR